MTGVITAVDGEQSLQMEWVRVERKCTVTPAKPAGLGRMCRLGPSDLQMIKCNYIQKGLLYRLHKRYRDDEEQEQEQEQTLEDDMQQANLVEVLKQGLAQALVDFYPLAGRFSVCSEGTVCIHCNDAGADFIGASAPSLSLAHVERPDIDPAVRQLFAADGSINTDGYNMPLLIVKVTRLKDGIFVALTMNHAVVDGTSLWHFVNSWADICRGVPGAPSTLPQHSRCFDAQGRPPLCLNVPRTTYASAGAFVVPSPERLAERIFHFRADTIADLKRAANKTKAPADPTDKATPQYSSFQALSAHIWQAITRARSLDAAAPTTFRLAINCRCRLVPPLPSAYFGNGIQIVSVAASAADVADNDLGQVADMLHRVIVGHRDGRIRGELERYGGCPVMFSLDSSSNNNNDNVVMMGSSPRFPMYDNDFGWGRPVAVRSGWGNKFDGKLSAYPSEHSSSCVDVEMCLHPQTLDALLSDPLFLAASSSSSPCHCSASS